MRLKVGETVIAHGTGRVQRATRPKPGSRAFLCYGDWIVLETWDQPDDLGTLLYRMEGLCPGGDEFRW